MVPWTWSGTPVNKEGKVKEAESAPPVPQVPLTAVQEKKHEGEEWSVLAQPTDRDGFQIDRGIDNEGGPDHEELMENIRKKLTAQDALLQQTVSAETLTLIQKMRSCENLHSQNKGDSLGAAAYQSHQQA